ncbi:GvpL/GvpF family gas vesicle protein (plasmid) [Tundrisphaera lichenicola]|uniref:GvpL/GvpF family gas vesicle protein n=1 Tax=Tundrisphaera lichenicola TaxID=2029860 RepID=UPI003EBBC371
MTGGCLAYAIARARGPDAPSFEGLSRFEAEGLAILHGPSIDGPLTVDLSRVEAYAAAVDRIHHRETILPLRYGCVVASEEGLAGLIRQHRDSWISSLDEVEGCDEMGLRLLLDTPMARPPEIPKPRSDVDRDRPGLAYLASVRARIEEERTRSDGATQVSDSIRDALAGLSRRSVIELPGPGRERLLSLSFLVPRSGLGAFADTVRNLSGRVPGKLLLTGPWPAYNFVGDDLIAR